MSSVVIYHNPKCSKSRRALAILQDSGVSFEIIEYLKTPPDAATLRAILAKLNLPPKELVRSKEHQTLGLPLAVDEDELIDQLVAHPEILQRPIVVVGNKAKIGRPPEQILAIL
ncbi:MAG: arsenate reductase (glutaredoxin) [Pirellulaceae bacterium]|nr:arsenate reductase (glutaredoxin) [Pirellulaceae bacterium]